MSAGTYISSPFLFINLGCEMIYILLNRLKAQKIDHNKSNRIISDITTTVFKQKFMTQLMYPQQALTVPILKDIFKKLAHSSIMKLDSTSMQKLFYLMLMTFKKQIYITSSPLQLFTLTVNHIQSLRVYTQSQDVKHLLHNVLQIFKEGVKNYTFLQYFWIKQQLLSILESYQTRIVTFIQAKQQDQKGHLVFFPRNSHNRKSIGVGLNHSDIQGLISDKNNDSFAPKNSLQYQNYAIWKTMLGINSFDDFNNTSKPSGSLNSSSNNKKINEKQQKSYFIEDSGTKSMKQMLGINKQPIIDFDFQLDLFGDGESLIKQSKLKEQLNLADYTGTNNTNKGSSQKTIQSQKTKGLQKKIDKQFEDLNLQKQQDQKDGDDLLAMMDS